MSSVLRNLGWALTLIVAIGSLLVYFVSQTLALQLAMLGFAMAAVFLVVAQALDVAARDDLDARQTRNWLLVVLLAAPPVGAIVYMLLGRARTGRAWAPPASDPDSARRVVHWQYAVGDPFHRDRGLTARALAKGSAPGSSPRIPPTKRT